MADKKKLVLLGTEVYCSTDNLPMSKLFGAVDLTPYNVGATLQMVEIVNRVNDIACCNLFYELTDSTNSSKIDTFSDLEHVVEGITGDIMGKSAVFAVKRSAKDSENVLFTGYISDIGVYSTDSFQSDGGPIGKIGCKVAIRIRLVSLLNLLNRQWGGFALVHKLDGDEKASGNNDNNNNNDNNVAKPLIAEGLELTLLEILKYIKECFPFDIVFQIDQSIMWFFERKKIYFLQFPYTNLLQCLQYFADTYGFRFMVNADGMVRFFLPVARLMNELELNSKYLDASTVSIGHFDEYVSSSFGFDPMVYPLSNELSKKRKDYVRRPWRDTQNDFVSGHADYAFGDALEFDTLAFSNLTKKNKWRGLADISFYLDEKNMFSKAIHILSCKCVFGIDGMKSGDENDNEKAWYFPSYVRYLIGPTDYRTCGLMSIKGEQVMPVRPMDVSGVHGDKKENPIPFPIPEIQS